MEIQEKSQWQQGACEKLGDTSKLRKATTNQEKTNNNIKFTTLFQKHITIPVTSL